VKTPGGVPSALVIGILIVTSWAPVSTISATIDNASCTATPFPDPYHAVSPCNSDAVTCAALSALFTWNPAADISPDAGYLRAYPLIAPAGLQNPDGTAQQPFNPGDDAAGFDTAAAWRDAADTATALVAYTTRRSQGAGRGNTLFDIVQYRYPTTAVDATGTPKPGAIPIDVAWEWWATARTTTAADGSRRVSHLVQYSPPDQPAGHKPAPPETNRWACQHASSV
jgi:hypothetical protein